MVLQERIELSTSPLPRECSTTELLQRLMARLLPQTKAAGKPHALPPTQVMGFQRFRTDSGAASNVFAAEPRAARRGIRNLCIYAYEFNRMPDFPEKCGPGGVVVLIVYATLGSVRIRSSALPARVPRSRRLKPDEKTCAIHTRSWHGRAPMGA